MINIKHKKYFYKSIDTWTNISLDSSNNQSMIESELKGINYDNVKERFVRFDKMYNKNAKSNYRSVDGMFFAEQKGKILFIEFKNGKNITNGLMKDNRNRECEKILKKSEDSIKIFKDITGQDDNYIKNNIIFLLVYNKDKTRKYREMCSKSVFRKANEEKIYFNLTRLKNDYNEIHTYDENEFRTMIFEPIIVKESDLLISLK